MLFFFRTVMSFFIIFPALVFAEEIEILSCEGPTIDPLLFGNNTHFYKENDGNYGQGGTEEFFDRLNMATIRFPGGEDADNYLWDHYKPKNQVRHPDKEHLLMPEAYPRQSNISAADNFMQHLNKIAGKGIESNFVVNVESAFISYDKAKQHNPDTRLQYHLNKYADYAADWVRAVRSAGHFVRYWEIGNEPYFDSGIRPLSVAEYSMAFTIFAKKMKTANPNIQIGAVGFDGYFKKSKIDRDNSGPAWWPELIKQSGQHIDFIAIHHYQQRYTKTRSTNGLNDVCTTHSDCLNPTSDTCYCGGGNYPCNGNAGMCKYASFANNILKGGMPLDEFFIDFRAHIEHSLDKGDIKIFVTEFNVFNKFHRSFSWRQHTAYLSEMYAYMIRGELDSLQLWPLSSEWSRPGNKWGFPMVKLPSARGNEPAAKPEALPPYHTYKMWQKHTHKKVAHIAKSNSMRAAFASCAPNKNKLSVVIINKSEEPYAIDLTGLNPGQYKVTELSASNEPKINDVTTVDYIPHDYRINYKKMKVTIPALATVFIDNLDQKPLSATKTGVYRPRNASFTLDTNGNSVWNRGTDSWSKGFAQQGDIPLTGDWNGNGKTQIGVYRPDQRAFLLDINGNKKWDGQKKDRLIKFGKKGDTPLIGDWDGDGRDQVAVYRPKDKSFSLDFNNNGRWDKGTDKWFVMGQFGDTPIAGDFTGDGRDNIGTFRPHNGSYSLQGDHNYQWDGRNQGGQDQWIGGFAKRGDIPVIGDWNGDGIDDIGAYRPSKNLFILDQNGNRKLDFKHDLFKAQGKKGDIPIAGNW